LRKKLLFVAAAGVALAVIAWHFWGPSYPPQAQPPLTILTAGNFDRFEKAFNDGPESARLVLLLSPT
jgi:hypothetical protein